MSVPSAGSEGLGRRAVRGAAVTSAGQGLRIAIQLALSSDVIGLQASDLNFVTAVLVTVALILPRLRRGGASS